MPPKPLSRKRAVEEETYESDGGFVEDAPKSKRTKNTAANELKQKDGKATVSTATQKDDEGNSYWEIGGRMRRIQVSNFKGATMVGIREFYEKDGKTLPGKKGISLSVDQFAAVLDVLPAIEKALQERGEQIPRPNYDGSAAAPDAEDEVVKGEDEEYGDGIEAEKVKEEHAEDRAPSKLERFKMKKNHEATDDEDE